MFWGFPQLDGNVTGMIATTSDGVSVVGPDGDPTYRIYSPTGTLMSSGDGTMTGPVDGQTGLYRLSHAVTAANGYAAGTTYTVQITYAISSVSKKQVASFTVS